MFILESFIAYCMAKNEPKLDKMCPRCSAKDVLQVGKELTLSSNVTVFKCHNPERDALNFLICDHMYAKDQSVKLSGSLVLEAAKCMQLVGGYSGLGEFVRECIRNQISEERRQIGEMALGKILAEATKDPETIRKLMEED